MAPEDDPAPRPTTLGALVLGLAATAFAAALVLGTLVPALLGVLLVALAHGARRSLHDATVTVTRTLPARVHLGDPFRLTTRVRGPDDQPLAVHDVTPDACLLQTRDHHHARGQAHETQVLTARHPGTIHWTHTRIETHDPWSLWARTRTVRHPDRLKVSPEPVWARQGHLLARRTPVGRRRVRHSPDPSPEIARVREHHPGDRVRDIDWKRSSRSERLYVRETERKGRRAVHVLLDASPPMRWARRHAKATTMLRIVHGTTGLARAAGLPVHLVAYHERGVVEERIHRPGALRRALDRLTDLPVPTTTAILPDRTGPRPPTTDAERRFLDQTAPLVSGPWAREPSDRAALLALTARRVPAGLVVAFLDAESDPHGTREKIQALVHHGHRVVLVVPPTGAHLYTRQEAEGQVLARLKDHLAARRRIVHDLHRLKVPVLMAAPGDERLVLKEVAERLT